ncbi:MAG: hypothetical protein P4L80_00415 [Xanthobacteraceae bacterium]|nr:hypothetical protein [Xanthobacteraceae bacterium]
MRNRSMSRLAVLAAIASAFAGETALAAGCQEYADQAVISATQNKDWNCGYSGRRWSFSYQEHYGWCRSVGYAAALPERLERQRLLHACHG